MWKPSLYTGFVRDENGNAVASLYGEDGSPHNDGVARDRTLLVSAAPDLLEALKGILSNPGGRCTAEQWRAGLAAISKAEGRTNA